LDEPCSDVEASWPFFFFCRKSFLSYSGDCWASEPETNNGLVAGAYEVTGLPKDNAPEKRHALPVPLERQDVFVLFSSADAS
jgi:hypothetical protein